MKKRVLVLMFALFAFVSYSKDMVITYRGPESKKDTRFDYPLALITEAMDKTKDEYGGYKLVPSAGMNFARASSAEYIDEIENFIFETTASEKNESNLLSVKIPIAKGLYGYRIFLINKNKQNLFKDVNSIADLKKLRPGQGKSWLDVKILKNSGFNVVTGPNYEGLFKMLLAGRFDAFPRGVNEAFHERDARINELPNLAVEETLCVYYPLPRFFYTSKKNTLFAERLEKGLEIMIEDGSFDKIWSKYNGHFVEQGKLANRKIFTIDNPFVPSVVPLDNPKYWYKP
jgi:hypothetical protein